MAVYELLDELRLVHIVILFPYLPEVIHSHRHDVMLFHALHLSKAAGFFFSYCSKGEMLLQGGE